MTFREFMTGVAYLPAAALSGLANLIFGSTKKDKHGRVKKDKVNPGLIGYILDGIKYVSVFFADLISNHKQAIAIAFWTSLLLAGAAALTVFLWPAALTAITTFTVFGISIASVVGANVLLQIGAVAALTFIATSAVTYFVAGIVNTIIAIKDCFSGKSDDQNLNMDENSEDFTSSEEEDFHNVTPPPPPPPCNQSILNNQEVSDDDIQESPEKMQSLIAAMQQTPNLNANTSTETPPYQGTSNPIFTPTSIQENPETQQQTNESLISTHTP